ncbi:hypothetical protein GZS04_23040 (plasmid) [Citrobacter freundii]|uniref:hypothetical protein n=1 Tax=Citrobacter freundii TaxID=546 RepID=UPI0013989C49|nr:hypothetical protein [Citrobacter freundii]QHX04849.1 hypothetical protein GZS04_23040 [Citrobacter freundii]
MMISYQELVRTFPELSFIDRRTFVLSAIGNCHGQVVDSPDNQRAYVRQTEVVKVVTCRSAIPSIARTSAPKGAA